MSERIRRSIVATAITLTLAACAVGPDYKRPDEKLPADFGAQIPTSTSDSQAGIPNDWWKLYNDPLLNDLVEKALANNPDIRIALARIEEAQGALRETNAAFFPAITASGIGARERIGVAGGSTGASTTTGVGQVAYGNFFQLEAGLSYELDFWGRLRRASETSRASLLATTYAKDFTALSLATSTSQAYFALRSLDAQIAVTQGTYQAVADSLGIAKKRLDAGYASGLDYAQAETLRAQIAVQLRELRRQRAIQEHQLGNLTSDLSLRIEPGNLDNLPVPNAPPAGLPSTLLERRPDVRSAEQQLVASNAQIGFYKAALFPTFSLTGAFGGQSLQLGDLLKAPFRFWSIGLGITEPIFAGGKYVARLDQARSRNDEQVASYQKTVEGAFQEVSNALTNVSESTAAEGEVRTQVEAARRSLKLSRERYLQGYTGYLDVLDATRTTNSAELLLVQNRQSRLNYTVDLIKALGGGWGNGDLQSSGIPIQPAQPLDSVSAPPPPR